MSSGGGPRGMSFLVTATRFAGSQMAQLAHLSWWLKHREVLGWGGENLCRLNGAPVLGSEGTGGSWSAEFLPGQHSTAGGKSPSSCRRHKRAHPPHPTLQGLPRAWERLVRESQSALRVGLSCFVWSHSKTKEGALGKTPALVGRHWLRAPGIGADMGGEKDGSG